MQPWLDYTCYVTCYVMFMECEIWKALLYWKTEQVDIIELLHDFSFLIITDNFQLQMSKLYLFFCLNAFLLTRKYDFVTNQVSGLGTNWFKIQSKTLDCNQVSSQFSFSRLQKFNYNFSGSAATQFFSLQSHHQHEPSHPLPASNQEI